MNKKAHVIKKVGFYDSGLGGLFVMSEVHKKFPNYDYVFLADEQNLPYGTKTVEELGVIARTCLDFLIEKEQCDVIVVACNTLSATVFEPLETEYKAKFPHVLLLDVITPTIDELDSDAHFSVFGTPRTILSHIYKNAILERFPDTVVDEYQAPELASLIEAGADTESYIRTFEKEVSHKPHTCILACTHYGLVAEVFKKVYPQFTTIVTQHVIVADLLSFILHVPAKDEEQKQVKICTTRDNPVFGQCVTAWFNGSTTQVISLQEGM